jgi:hypothetical protein
VKPSAANAGPTGLAAAQCLDRHAGNSDARVARRVTDQITAGLDHDEAVEVGSVNTLQSPSAEL